MQMTLSQDEKSVLAQLNTETPVPDAKIVSKVGHLGVIAKRLAVRGPKGTVLSETGRSLLASLRGAE